MTRHSRAGGQATGGRAGSAWLRVPALLAAAVLCSGGPRIAFAADGNLDSVASIVTDPDGSPLPYGWTAGAASYVGSSPYRAESGSVLAFPGAIYLSPKLMFLGDRVNVTVHYSDEVRYFARARLRFGNLSPQDHPEWTGLRSRDWEVEAGGGVQVLTPVGIVTVRASSDVIGRSRGQDAIVSLDLPYLRERFVVMPSLAVIYRSSNLANYYFGGVSRAEASPLHEYHDTGAMVSASVSVVGSYRISRRWLGAAIINYEHYPAGVRTSPLIGRSGSYDFLVGVGYSFR